MTAAPQTHESSSYEYHGGSAPPKATDITVEKTAEVQEIKPAVVHETVAAVEREEIQPVVEREREETEIRQVVQPLLDVRTEATTVEKVELEEEEHKYREKAKEADVEKYEAQAASFKDEVREENVVHEKVFLEPIIHEVVKKRVIHEVQPVIERVVHKTHVVEETQHVKETFVKAPVVRDQEIAPPMSIDEFQRVAGTTSSPKAASLGSPVSPGPMTRLKRKKLSEAADGPASSITKAGDDGSVDVSYPNAMDVSEPSTLHGTLGKIAGVVEGVVGEIIGSDKLVADAEARKAEAELEIEAAGAAKKRKTVA